MKIHYNLYYQDKIYNTKKDSKEMRDIVNKVVEKDRTTIASIGTLVKKRKVVKFKDGSWFTLSDQMSTIIGKIETLDVAEVVSGTLSIKNSNGINKKYLISSDFEKIMSILDFEDKLEISTIYEIEGVSGGKRLNPKHFFKGEEVELIEWAVKNKIWPWLKKIEN